MVALAFIGNILTVLISKMHKILVAKISDDNMNLDESSIQECPNTEVENFFITDVSKIKESSIDLTSL